MGFLGFGVLGEKIYPPHTLASGSERPLQLSFGWRMLQALMKLASRTTRAVLGVLIVAAYSGFC